MLKEFKEFALKGNAVDLAVGVVIGTAFGQIVNSLVKDIIMPPIGVLTGGIDFSDKVFILKEATSTTSAVILQYGLFLNNVLNFLIIGFSIFIIIKQMNRFKKEKPAIEPELTKSEKLLTEIRDNLKK